MVGTYGVETRPSLKLLLQNCFYSPELIANYMSASKLNKHGMNILLWKDKVVKTKNKVAALRPNQSTCFNWHKALGHLNFEDVRDWATDCRCIEVPFLMNAKLV